METEAQQGGSRQLRAQFYFVHWDGAVVTTGFRKGGTITRSAQGVYVFTPDSMASAGGGVGTCDPNRTTIELCFRNSGSPAAFQSFAIVWAANGTSCTITTQQNAANADLDFDLLVKESERSGQVGAN